LEYCEPDKAVDREQAYMDLLQPQYNILTKAGSLLGFRHSEDTIAKFKTRSLSAEQKAKRLDQLNILNTNKDHREKAQKNILKYNMSISKRIEVIDTLNSESTVYSSISEAARAIDCAHPSIIYALKKLKEKGIHSPGRYMVKPLNE
jgi:group I intron endonuclease